ncbi:MAG TPA: heme-degrading domain-containing protein [Rectinemataceae bacterium]|nr:heme-degrading domain-containing protein [Rectinemataceae bacterium]
MTAAEYETVLERIRNEERELQFDHFSNDDALALGLSLVELARTRGLQIAIDISRGQQQLFHFACAGSSADNDAWIIRKNRVVSRFGRSSLAVGTSLARDGTGIESKYYVSAFEYSPHGGAFPIILRGTGPIGTVTVSGLPQEEDHALVVEALRAYLAGKR